MTWMLAFANSIVNEAFKWLQNDAAKTIAAAAAGALSTLILQKVGKSTGRAVRRWRIHRAVARGDFNMTEGKFLEFGPKIIVSDDSLIDTGERFYLPIPEQTKAALRSKKDLKDQNLDNYDIFGGADVRRISSILGNIGVNLS